MKHLSGHCGLVIWTDMITLKAHVVGSPGSG